MVFEESVKLKVTWRRQDTRNTLAHEVAWKNHHKAEADSSETQNRAIRGLWLQRFERLTGEGGDVIVVVCYGCVSLGVCVVPVMEGSTNDTGEEPLCQCRRVRQNCPCHGCSPAKKSNLNLVLPSTLE